MVSSFTVIEREEILRTTKLEKVNVRVNEDCTFTDCVNFENAYM